MDFVVLRIINFNLTILEMKHLLLIALMVSGFTGFCQEALKFTEVISVEGATQKQLFDRAKIWLIKSYKSSKDVTQSFEPESGQIIGKANFDFKPKSFMGSEAVKGVVSYTLSIFCKDGKYKYVVEDFRHEKFGLVSTDENAEMTLFGSSKGYKKKTWADIRTQCEEHSKFLSESLKQMMMKKSDAEF